MRKKICFVVAVPGTANSFLRDHIAALSQHYDVYLAGNIPDAASVERLALAGWKQVGIMRPISVVNDLKAVVRLTRYFRQMRFDAVHSVTPKAGLICSLAGWLARIPHRTHIFTGQVWATRTGAMRRMLRLIDRITASFANHILVDGEPQRQFLIANRVVTAQKSQVLGEGSISGVNTVRFTPTDADRRAARQELRLDDDKVAFCFMGRQNREKGIYELYEAFNRLAGERKQVVLLLFGSDEGDCMSHLGEYRNIAMGDNCIFYGRTTTPEHHLQAADVFCMPSYREGFGTSVIEASCLGLPVICSDVYGLQDAMVDGATGLRCKVADADSLYEAMKQYADSPQLRQQHGRQGRSRVLAHFAGETITAHWLAFYRQLLPLASHADTGSKIAWGGVNR